MLIEETPRFATLWGIPVNRQAIGRPVSGGKSPEPVDNINKFPQPLEMLKKTVKSHFGATLSSSPVWNPDADLNKDGVINVKDLAVVRELATTYRVRQSFGISSADGSFDSGADINGDGVVNVLDKAVVRNRLLRLCA